jgi:hypothetical protein
MAKRNATRKAGGKKARKNGTRKNGNPWMEKVMRVFHRERKSNKNFKLGQAMKRAKNE